MIVTKCVVVGDSGIGKSSLSEYYINGNHCNDSHHPTIAIEFFGKTIVRDGKKIKLQIWDTAGQERFKSITRTYYRDSVGALVCFSITNRKSFKNLEEYIEDVKLHSDSNIQIILVGTFSDMYKRREVSREEAEKFAKDLNVPYYEVSAKTGTNVNECFDRLVNRILECYKSGEIPYHESYDTISVLPSDNSYLPEMSSCCNFS